MNNLFKKMMLVTLVVMIGMAAFTPIRAYAADTTEEVTVEEGGGLSEKAAKAFGAGGAVGLVAAAGAIGMAIAIGKSAESISRQPEAEGKIRTVLMLGLVFIETAIIYALIVAILIIFVL